MNRIVLNGAGVVYMDPECRSLTPLTLMTAVRLWWMIQKEPRKAALRMSECEQIASAYAEGDQGWFWNLPIPPNYQPCPYYVC